MSTAHFPAKSQTNDRSFAWNETPSWHDQSEWEDVFVPFGGKARQASKRAEEKRVLRDWQALFEESSYFRGRTHCVQSRFRDGVLRLQGVLPTWYLKQILQQLAAQCPGIQRVDNQVQVTLEV